MTFHRQLNQSFSHSGFCRQAQIKIVIEHQFYHWVQLLILISKPNMTCAVIFLFLVTILEVKGNCLAGKCEKISLDLYWDAVLDSEFVGQVFHNSVTLNPIQCYTWCRLSVFVSELQGEQRPEILWAEWRKSFYQQKFSQTLSWITLLHSTEGLQHEGNGKIFALFTY